MMAISVTRLSVLASVLLAFLTASGDDVLRVAGGAPTFGPVTLRSPMEQPRLTVQVQNVSDRTRRVEHVSVGCGCIEVEPFEAFVLQPGEVAEVHLKLNPLKVSEGHIKYPMGIFGEGQRLASTTVEYVFLPAVLPMPRIIWLEQSDGDPTRLRAMGALRLRGVTAAQVVAKTDDSRLRVQITEGETPATAELVATISGDMPVGEFDAMIELVPQGASDGIYVKVRGTVEHPIEPTPAVVLFRPLPIGESAERTIRLRRKAKFDRQIQVAAISSDVKEGLKCEVRASDDGTALVVVTATGMNPRLQTANITIHITGVQVPLVVPVSWRATS